MWQHTTTAMTHLSEEEIKCTIFCYSSLKNLFKAWEVHKIFSLGFLKVFLVTARIFIPFFSITFSRHHIVMFSVMKSGFLRVYLYATVIWESLLFPASAAFTGVGPTLKELHIPWLNEKYELRTNCWEGLYHW